MAIWDCIETFSRSIALYLRPVILAVNFEHYLPKDSTIELIKVLKDYYLANKIPSKLKISETTSLPIPKSMILYLKSQSDDQYLNPHRLEFFVYKKLYHHLDRGRIFCNDSVSYRDIDADLVPESMVDKVDEIVQQYGYHKIPIYCSTYLDQKLLELDNKWKEINDNIENNKVYNRLQKDYPDGFGYVPSKNEMIKELNLSDDESDELKKSLGNIGYSHKIVLPIYDEKGEIMGLIGKNMNYDSSSEFSEYIYNKGLRSGTLMGIEDIDLNKPIILVGELSDVLIARANGIENVVSLNGSGISIRQLELLNNLGIKEVNLCFNDNAITKQIAL